MSVAYRREFEAYAQANTARRKRTRTIGMGTGVLLLSIGALSGVWLAASSSDNDEQHHHHAYTPDSSGYEEQIPSPSGTPAPRSNPRRKGHAFAPSPTLPASNQVVAGTYMVPNSTTQETFSLSPELAATINQISEISGLPAPAILATCAHESRCQPKSINPRSKACGLYQFMTNDIGTLYEVTFENAANSGYGYASSWVKRKETAEEDGGIHYEYVPANWFYESKLKNLCLDAGFSTAMFGSYMAPLVKNYEAWLGNRKATAGEIVGINFLGLTGFKTLTRQAWRDVKKGTDTLAKDFFGRPNILKLFGGNVAEQNRAFAYHRDGSPRTVREALNYIKGFGNVRLDPSENGPANHKVAQFNAS